MSGLYHVADCKKSGPVVGSLCERSYRFGSTLGAPIFANSHICLPCWGIHFGPSQRHVPAVWIAEPSTQIQSNPQARFSGASAFAGPCELHRSAFLRNLTLQEQACCYWASLLASLTYTSMQSLQNPVLKEYALNHRRALIMV